MAIERQIIIDVDSNKAVKKTLTKLNKELQTQTKSNKHKR